MISSTYDWQLENQEADPAFLAAAKKVGLTAQVATLAFGRGLTQPDLLQAFLEMDLTKIHSPYVFPDMEKAVERIHEAIAAGERILVYGDYDADGMTSAAIVKEALDMLGAESQVYLPNRFTDGYGPNLSVYQYFIEQEAISLIITVDNGVSGHEAISYAQEQGVDVIITDHHSLPDTLPSAFAIIHPEASDYPFKHLAGCGVVFKLAWALLEDMPTELLDLVAIGSIADMVSLTDENRIMVKVGLSLLKQTERLGLQEMLRLAGITPDQVTEETVGFTLAPQLNALGRLDDPNPAIDLLTGFDDEEARDIAQMIQAKNEERKTLVQDIFDQALAMIDKDKPVQVLAKEGWHPGVLGIVAGRLLEKLGQPVIVLGIADGKAKGSARSPERLDLFEALNPRRDLFVAFGGHSGAAGMTLELEQVSALSDYLSQYMLEHGLDHSQKPSLHLDGELDLSQLSLETIKSLDKLAPFGMDNPKPIFWLKDFQVKQARSMGQDSRHLKLKIDQDGQEFDVVAFHQGHLAQEFQQVKGLELAVSLSVNQWNGTTSLQLMLEDARVAGLQLFDIRSKTARLPEGVPVLTADEKSPVVVVDQLPASFAELKALFAGRTFEAIYFKNSLTSNYYLTGYGTREQFAKLYKTIYQFPDFDVRHKLKTLADYLKIPSLLLVKMIQIFEELGFVTITDGIMTVVKDAPKRAIDDSQIYQDLKATVAYQELMALGSPQEIYDRLTN